MAEDASCRSNAEQKAWHAYGFMVLVLVYFIATSWLWTKQKMKQMLGSCKKMMEADKRLNQEHQSPDEPWQLITGEKETSDADTQTIATTLMEPPPPPLTDVASSSSSSSEAWNRFSRSRKGAKIWRFSGKPVVHFSDCAKANLPGMEDAGTICKLCG